MMRSIRNTLALALVVAGALAVVGVNADERQESYPHLWIKSEFWAQSTTCFVADRSLYCPYDVDMPTVSYDVIGAEELPPIQERRSALFKLRVSQK